MTFKELIMDFAERLSSRKFLAMLGLVLLLLADNIGLVLDPQIRNSLLIVVIAYITAEGAADVATRLS